MADLRACLHGLADPLLAPLAGERRRSTG